MLFRASRDAGQEANARYGVGTGRDSLRCAICLYGMTACSPLRRGALVADIKSVYRNDDDAAGEKVHVDLSNVVITLGCNQAFYLSLMAIAGAGDEVIVPIPWFFNHA